jgi:hypothetical protein
MATWQKCYTGCIETILAETKFSPWLRPRNEESPAAASPLRSASEAARVQPFKCSQQVRLATRKLPQLSLLRRKQRKPFPRGLPYRGASIPCRDPPRRHNPKPKPQTLNQQKSPPSAIRPRPSPKPKPRGLTRRLHLRLRHLHLRFVNEAPLRFRSSEGPAFQMLAAEGPSAPLPLPIPLRSAAVSPLS